MFYVGRLDLISRMQRGAASSVPGLGQSYQRIPLLSWHAHVRVLSDPVLIIGMLQNDFGFRVLLSPEGCVSHGLYDEDPLINKVSSL